MAGGGGCSIQEATAGGHDAHTRVCVRPGPLLGGDHPAGIHHAAGGGGGDGESGVREGGESGVRRGAEDEEAEEGGGKSAILLLLYIYVVDTMW